MVAGSQSSAVLESATHNCLNPAHRSAIAIRAIAAATGPPSVATVGMQSLHNRAFIHDDGGAGNATAQSLSRLGIDGANQLAPGTAAGASQAFAAIADDPSPSPATRSHSKHHRPQIWSTRAAIAAKAVCERQRRGDALPVAPFAVGVLTCKSSLFTLHGEEFLQHVVRRGNYLRRRLVAPLHDYQIAEFLRQVDVGNLDYRGTNRTKSIVAGEPRVPP